MHPIYLSPTTQVYYVTIMQTIDIEAETEEEARQSISI